MIQGKIFYKDKFKKLQKKKDYSSSDMVTSSMDYNDKTTDSHSFFMNLKVKSKNNNSKNNTPIINKIIVLNKLKYKKKKMKKWKEGKIRRKKKNSNCSTKRNKK